MAQHIGKTGISEGYEGGVMERAIVAGTPYPYCGTITTTVSPLALWHSFSGDFTP